MTTCTTLLSHPQLDRSSPPACASASTLALLLTVTASPVAAFATTSPLTEVTPWSARCYTDTCAGFLVTFDGGHTVALGYPSDAPAAWAICASADLTADEATLAVATAAALIHQNLPSLVAANPDIPSWYMDSLATYMASIPPR